LIFKLPLLIFACTNNLISCVYVTLVRTAETEQPYWSLGIEGRNVCYAAGFPVKFLTYNMVIQNYLWNL